ncbi:hypothetical protein [Escherichia coli]|uniref:gp53-like domain-containing protein n=1 Tax=Escherichia coli TaxID=562 RepID=UPI00208DBCF3|nr:hypothetical protein [Escherichia coli]
MALQLLAANNAQSVLAAGISASATSLTLNTGTGALFPSPVSGTSFFKLTLIDAATGSLTEIVHVTARAGDVFTIQRGQEGTVPRAWSANDIAANMMTAGTLSYILGNFQPLDPTLTALAALVGVANKLPYFNGDDTAALTDLTQVGRDIIGKTDIAAVLQYLGLTNAIIGDTCKEAGFYSGSALAPYLMHEDTHTPIRLVTLDSVHRVTTTTYTINYYANGLIHILGMTPTVSSLTPKTMTFPVAFPNACIRFALHNQESGVPSYNMAMYSNLSRTGAKIWGVANILGNGGSPTLGALPDAEISYEAWGY